MNSTTRTKSRWPIIGVVLCLIAFFVWSTDKMTLQDERTLYTADCLHGAWVGNHCGGELSAGPRFRYRALKAHQEVLFWVMGANEPSSRLTGCTIYDGRNWSCPVSADAPKSLTLALAHGEPVNTNTFRLPDPVQVTGHYAGIVHGTRGSGGNRDSRLPTLPQAPDNRLMVPNDFPGGSGSLALQSRQLHPVSKVNWILLNAGVKLAPQS